MITLGLPRTIAAHDVTQGATTVTIPAATWASPLEYIEAALAAVGQTATVAGVAVDKLYITASGSPDWLEFENTTAGNQAAGYVGATLRILQINQASAGTDYLWTGQEQRIPGLLRKVRGSETLRRSGHHGQPGQIYRDTLSVWSSRGTIAEIEIWLEFALVWLAGPGAVEVRSADGTAVWYLDVTDIELTPQSADGLYTTCDLPLLRRA